MGGGTAPVLPSPAAFSPPIPPALLHAASRTEALGSAHCCVCVCLGEGEGGIAGLPHPSTERDEPVLFMSQRSP